MGWFIEQMAPGRGGAGKRLAIGAVLAVAGCAASDRVGGDAVQTRPRYDYDIAVADDVRAMAEGIATAERRARFAELLRRAK